MNKDEEILRCWWQSTNDKLG